LVVKALATPEVLMHPVLCSWLITFVVLLGVATAVTVIGTECVRDPYVPKAVRVKLVGVMDGPRVIDNVLGEVEPPLGGVIGLGDTDAVTPAGMPETPRLTGKLNPPNEPIVTCDGPDEPMGMVMLVGVAEMEKSPTFSVTGAEVLPLKWLSPEYMAVSIRVP
jgi:hypothetical protein